MKRKTKINVTLSPDIGRFVKRNVKDGRYESASDVVGTALRLLQSRDHLLGSAGSISNMGVGDSDIEAIAFIVMMQATKDMDEDLKMIMAEIKAMTNAKAKLRDVICKVRRDIVSNAGQRDSKEPLKFPSNGIGSAQAYHRIQMPIPDPETDSGVKFVQTDLHKGIIDNVAILESIRDCLNDRLDSMNEITELTSLRLQMTMDRRSKFFSTLSNLMKKISDTQETLVSNLK